MRSFKLQQTAALLALFVMTSTGLILLDQQHRLDGVKASANDALRPLEQLLTRGQDRIVSVAAQDESGLAQQLEEVTTERNRLLAENTRLKQLEEEVAQLRQQLEFKTTRPELQPLLANVIRRDPDGVARAIVIDRGAQHGVQVGMAVVSPDFFIGQVTKVEQKRAWVTLVTDVSSQVGAKLQAADAEGVVYGRWQAGEGHLLEMRHLDVTTPVEVGDLAVTSGRTVHVPGGLVIGKVVSVDRELEADSMNVQVEPLIDYPDLKSVSVILSDGLQQSR